MSSVSLNLSDLDGSNGFVIEHPNRDDFDRTYVEVNRIGDINGDGFADLLVNTKGVKDGKYDYYNYYSYSTTVLRSYVVFGGTNVGAGGSIDLSKLDGSNGFAINGISTPLDYSLSIISDINGDGINDLIIRAPFADPNGVTNAGSIYVLYGGTNLGAGGSIDLSNLDGSNGFAINGINQDDYLGNSINSISSDSDLNADGINDLIIRAYNADPNGVKDAGSVYVLYSGTNLGEGGSIDLSNLNGSNGFAINGINPSDRLGYDSIISDSDINADGINDLIISASNADPNGVKDAGSIYVLYGGTNMGAGGSINLSNLNGSNGFAINGINPSDYLGSSISSDLDINADGINDLIIRAPYADPNGVKDAGSIYVLYGGTNLGAGGSINLSNLNGSNGFAINGINPSDRLGNSINLISSDLDLNADGINDLIIRARDADPNGVTNAGSVYVLYGGTNMGVGGSINLSNLNDSNGFAINGINPYGYLGDSIISDSDINADGINDLIIGDRLANPNGVKAAGSVYVLYGGTNLGAGGSIDLSNLNGSNGFAINGINPYDYLGLLISSDSDINTDGINDLIIGVLLADPNGVNDAGSVYVLYGGTNLGAGGSIDLSNLNGSNGFAINGINPYDHLGLSIISDSDINADGINDLIIRASSADPNGVNDAGSIYVLYGGTNLGAGGSIDLSNLNGSNGFAINGINPSDRLGYYSIINDSDLNADGINDLIIRAPDADPNGVYNAGSVYVLYCGTNMGAGGSIDLSNLDGSNGFAINGINPYDRLGNSISKLGDINSDGIDDIVLRGYEGASYVVFGSKSSQLSPNAVNDRGITTLNTPLTLNVLANDTNVAQISAFDTTSTKGGTVTLDDNSTPTDLTDDQLVYAPPTDFIGFDSFSYTLDRGQGYKSTATVNIGVFSQVGIFYSDTLIAGNTGELIRGAAGNDLITGGDGNDKLLGNYGNDTLIGGLGNDALCGGWGKDVLTGGEGRDRFWLIPDRGTDTITDFEDGVDKLVLYNLRFRQLSITQSNNDALISVAGTGEVLATLTGVQANLLTAADFDSQFIRFG